MYDLIIELGQTIAKHGLSLSALGTAIFVLLKQRKVKRALRKRLPWLLKDDADVMNYEARQIRIENDVRAIKEHLGVREWDAEKKDSLPVGAKVSLISRWVDMCRVTSANVSMVKESTTYFHRRDKTMKAYLKKLTRTKLQAYLLATIMNIALLVGYVMDVQDIQSKVDAWMPMANMTVQTVLTLIYVWVEGSIDKEQIKAEVSNDTTFKTPVEPTE